MDAQTIVNELGLTGTRESIKYLAGCLFFSILQITSREDNGIGIYTPYPCLNVIAVSSLSEWVSYIENAYDPPFTLGEASVALDYLIETGLLVAFQPTVFENYFVCDWFKGMLPVVADLN